MDFGIADSAAYNEPFTMAELESAVSSLRSVSEGPDAVHNDMLRRLPRAALEALLAMYNSLWETGLSLRLGKKPSSFQFSNLASRAMTRFTTDPFL